MMRSERSRSLWQARESASNFSGQTITDPLSSGFATTDGPLADRAGVGGSEGAATPLRSADEILRAGFSTEIQPQISNATDPGQICHQSRYPPSMLHNAPCMAATRDAKVMVSCP